MPIIDHADLGWAPVTPQVRERYLVSREHGAASLTIKEVEIAPRWESRLHTHPVDVSMQVMSGAIQAITGDEVRHAGPAPRFWPRPACRTSWSTTCGPRRRC